MIAEPPTDATIVRALTPIRKWTVPIGDCVARPTRDFYTNGRHVILSNASTPHSPNWVALDRYNDPDWADHQYAWSDDFTKLGEEIHASGERLYNRLSPLPASEYGWPPYRPFPMATLVLAAVVGVGIWVAVSYVVFRL